MQQHVRACAGALRAGWSAPPPSERAAGALALAPGRRRSHGTLMNCVHLASAAHHHRHRLMLRLFTGTDALAVISLINGFVSLLALSPISASSTGFHAHSHALG